MAGVNERTVRAGEATVPPGRQASLGVNAADRLADGRDVSGVAAAPGSSGVVVRRPSGPPVFSPWPPGRGHVAVPPAGMQLPRQLPFETWLGIGRQLSVVAASSAWCLGDWLAYGQKVYGQRYREAVDRTGLDYQTLRNYAWVARQFGWSRRRLTLSFGHHAEVASLPEPEQDFWLRKAEQFRWSTSQLRREVRASLRERGTVPAPIQPGNPSKSDETGEAGRRAPLAEARVTVPVALTPEQAQLCGQAAERQGMSVPAWAAQVLDRAIRHGL